MRTLSLLVFASMLSACSAYQSDGRKYLEKSAYDLAGLKLRQQFIGCAPTAPPVPGDAPWLPTRAADPRAHVFERDLAHAFELRITPENGAQSCDYGFASAADRARARDLAIAATLDGAR